MPKRDAVFNFRYKMKYPGRGAYHFPTGASHTSPCMSQYWRERPILACMKQDDKQEV